MAGGLELDDLHDPFQCKAFYDSMILFLYLSYYSYSNPILPILLQLLPILFTENHRILRVGRDLGRSSSPPC